MKIGLIGFGGIGQVVAQVLAQMADGPALVGVLLRPGSRPALPPGCLPCHDLEALLALEPNCVVECAGHRAVREHALPVLESGRDLLLISTGALAEPGLLDRLTLVARRSGSRLKIAPGAVGGIDALAAARLGGLERVLHTVVKPPAAWTGSPAEAKVDLASLTEATILYEGNAGEAAAAYPQNANVSATIALAGLGLERTRVRLVADPAADGNLHRLEASGSFGTMRVEMCGRALAANPKTSAMAALSLARAVVNLEAAVTI